MTSFSETGQNIAIIGMAGRFPGAQNIDEFWQNIKNGIESISFFSDEELMTAGIDPASLADPNYVKAKGILENVTDFDAAFFNLSPREAEITDPQQRLFLECAWEALENASYDPKSYPGKIGVYGGISSFDNYFLRNLYPNVELRRTIGDYQLVLHNEKDFLCTRVSYKLNLTGPSETIQTACSTSLVAVVTGCQSLLNYQTDIVLAGGAAITLPQKSGYLYQEGMILSPDGHCRAFDSKAQGTVDGNGVGVVVLKRLEEAVRDGDHIYAVIKGAAANNDGSSKVGFTAPSIKGQTEVIAEALALAEVPATTIRYVETHGTSTPIGDPIEISALTDAFRLHTDKKCFCAIGSVKTNIGHLDVAAGVTGLIKTALMLKHRLIPPSLHFNTPNPKIDFATSPFYVNTHLVEWEKTGDIPRRAGLSSFGMGGTNVHLILEEAPERSPAMAKLCPYELILLSAKTVSALKTMTQQLIEHLKQHPHLSLADVAHTYQAGRYAFNYRRTVIGQTVEEVIQSLQVHEVIHQVESKEPGIVFMFSGQGAQYVNMGLELYHTEPLFHQQIDYGAKFLEPHLKFDLRSALYPDLFPGTTALNIHQTALTQPILFLIEHALARLWMSWGILPQAMIGHSIGEYVAACLAGVFSLEEALELVAVRGRLMQSMPPGGMLAVPLTEEELRPFLKKPVDLAVINIPSQSVVAGPHDALEQLVVELTAQGIESQYLQTSHAFHSDMMSPVLPLFLEQVRKIDLKPPQLPFISNVTATWITPAQATSPDYWVNHLRHTVRFAEGLQELFKTPSLIFLEVGPGNTLGTFAKRHPAKTPKQVIFTSLRHPKEESSDSAFLLKTLGGLWSTGVSIAWSKFHASEQRYRLPLPTYPFERKRYWIEANSTQTNMSSSSPEEPHDMVDLQHSRPRLSTTYIAPRNSIEQSLVKIWQEFFSINQIGVEDDFFELGGDSLMAVQLVSRIRKVIQSSSVLSPGHLLTSPTIEALALWFSAHHEKPTWPFSLVELQEGSPQKRPLFLVHPSGGQVYVYRSLARCLGTDQPVYGLQAACLENQTDPSQRIEEMATHYIHALQARQPQGPYWLGGASFGGTCAFEMAQQLRALNQQVELLVMIDTPRLDTLPPSQTVLDDLHILRLLLGLKEEFPTMPQLTSDERLEYFLQQYAKTAHSLPSMEPKEIRYFLDIFKKNYQSMIDYHPQSYPGRVVFFRAHDYESNPPHPERAWLEVVEGGIESYEISGNHITMNFSPHVEGMAEHLKKYLVG